ncbi:hypothetical protein ACHZ97_18340 [Lysobacter soli]|uniref:hypothetical protein n=1 Tax=Lysobacter soli TaxID=453783 RepID=UPI0037C53C97
MATKKNDDSSKTSVEERVSNAVEAKRTRKTRPFPACSFEEALEFARSAFNFASGQPVRRLSLFDHIGKSSESGASRQVVTNCNKYGLLEGGYTAEFLKITQDGARAVDDEIPKREQTKARVKLAIQEIPVFDALYNKFVNNKLPPRAALIDAAKDAGTPPDLAEEAVDTFTVNLRFVGLLQTLSGAERIVTLDHLLDTLPASSKLPSAPSVSPSFERSDGHLVTANQAEYDTTCFYITPIGDDGSEQRQHSDLFLGAIVEPALEPFRLKVVRADAIDKPGTITRQIIDYILRSRLVIADLSFHNPNVFYELAIRHAARLPVVQIIRSSDRIPFDLNQMRTIRVDTTTIYSLVPKIDLYRTEISSQVRRVLEDADATDNPISTFAPGLRIQLS